MRAIKEIIYFVHAAAVLLLIAMVASLLPGDKVNSPVAATFLAIVFIVVADAIITAPLYAVVRRRARP
jgi:hypothetical protein